MERIKEALELAKLSGKKKREKPTSHKAKSFEPDITQEIVYSKTQIVPVKKNILKRNRIITHYEHAEANTAYRLLRTQVLQKLVANHWNTLAITSTGPEEGKSLTAINLAISLAREVNYTVLLVDLDMRRPSINKYFGFNSQLGISDFFLSEQMDLGGMLINPDIERLVILPGRESITNSSEILKSNRMAQLVNELKSRYPSRIVIFDLPPLLSSDDALAFSPFVDAFLMVIEEGATSSDDIQQAMRLLKDVNILGTVLNKSKEKLVANY